MSVMSAVKTLISTKCLHEKLTIKASSRLLVLDTSFKADQSVDGYKDMYLKEHIPESRFYDLHACVNSTSLIPRNMPESYCFTKRVRALGIHNDSEIIVYDRTKTAEAAARAWWVFRLFGHENISILDGGLQKWIADGYDITQDEPTQTTEGDFEARLNLGLIRDKEDMKEIIKTNSAQIVDARGHDVFDGKTDHSETLSGGHVPGAYNVPFASLFNDDGTYKNAEKLKQLFIGSGVDLDRPMVSMCRTAMTACTLAVASHHVGKTDVPVYYGSWMEWANVMPDMIEKSTSPKQKVV